MAYKITVLRQITGEVLATSDSAHLHTDGAQVHVEAVFPRSHPVLGRGIMQQSRV